MRVMYFASNPATARPLQIEHEINELQDRLDRGAGSDPIDFRSYSHLAVGDLTEKIALVKPDVLHFAAHGDSDSLVFAHPTDGHVALDGPKLAALLGALAIKPKLIVINACSSNGMAASLAAVGAADFVIGTDATISNGGARAMAAALYQRLADAASIGDAFTVAATNLALIDQGNVAVTLHPEGSMAAARMVHLVDPLRIVACIPTVEAWLDAELAKPDRHYRPERPCVKFGVAGVPAAARQTVLFTDDGTVQPRKKESLEEARSWIVESQPDNGEIWMDDEFEYYGEMNWYVAVTTTDERIVSTGAKTTVALRRYYFDERWRGELPESIAKAVRQSIDHLALNGGSRRGRKPPSGR